MWQVVHVPNSNSSCPATAANEVRASQCSAAEASRRGLHKSRLSEHRRPQIHGPIRKPSVVWWWHNRKKRSCFAFVRSLMMAAICWAATVRAEDGECASPLCQLLPQLWSHINLQLCIHSRINLCTPTLMLLAIPATSLNHWGWQVSSKLHPNW